jgi:hypothetical protein
MKKEIYRCASGVCYRQQIKTGPSNNHVAVGQVNLMSTMQQNRLAKQNVE